MLCPCAYPTCSAHIHTLADCCDHQLLCYAYTVIPQMRPGPFWARPFRTTLLLKHCRPCSCRSRRSSGTSHNLYVQTLSSASAGHECMCACKPCLCLCSSSSVCLDPETVNASSFHLSYDRFYLPFTGIPHHEDLLCACSTTTCDRQRAFDSVLHIATSNSASAQLTDSSIRDSAACPFVRSRTTQPIFHTCFLCFATFSQGIFAFTHSHI